MSSWLRGALIALVASASIPAVASATVIINTGPGFMPDWDLSNGGTGAFQYLAAQFHLDSAAVLTDVEGWVRGAGTFRVGIASQSNSGPDRPNTTQYVQQASASGTANWYGAHGVSWSLGSGDWWVFFAVNPALGDTLNGTMPGGAGLQLGPEAFLNHSSGGDWKRYDDLGLGVRITDNTVPPPVPEPASWALMIAGFGLAGANLRRRRYA